MDENDLRKKSLKSISETNFFPSQGANRLSSMIKSRPDWCISRQRSWGVPIPLLINKNTGEIHPQQNLLFNEIADLIEESGIEAWDNVDVKDLVADHDDYVKATDT